MIQTNIKLFDESVSILSTTLLWSTENNPVVCQAGKKDLQALYLATTLEHFILGQIKACLEAVVCGLQELQDKCLWSTFRLREYSDTVSTNFPREIILVILFIERSMIQKKHKTA